jgi:hypothetical protein
VLDDEFIKEAEESSGSIRKWFKKYYKYSSTDPRYTEATESLMLNDCLDYLIDIYNEEIGSDPEKFRMLRGRLLNPQFDQDENEAFKKALANIKVLD